MVEVALLCLLFLVAVIATVTLLVRGMEDRPRHDTSSSSSSSQQDRAGGSLPFNDDAVTLPPIPPLGSEEYTLPPFPPITDTNNVTLKERLRTAFGIIDELVLLAPSNSSHQEQALEWLVSDDHESIELLHSHPNNNNSSSNSSNSNSWTALNNYQRLRLTQRYALMVFHLETGCWNQHWLTDNGTRHHECWWYGVFCDELTDTTIEGLQMKGSGIQGSLPSELGLLTDLNRFLLDVSPLTGQIPEELYHLTDLRALRVSSASLTATLSTRIGQLTNLGECHAQRLTRLMLPS